MLLAQSPAPMANPHSHSRRRPKLSLNITSAAPAAAAMASILSPTSRNTAYNARPGEFAASAYTPSSSSSSSSSEDESTPPLTPRRTKRMSAFQPVTAGAGFGMALTPRAKRCDGRRVQFRDEVVVIEAEAEYEGRLGTSARRRCRTRGNLSLKHDATARGLWKETYDSREGGRQGAGWSAGHGIPGFGVGEKM
ncbi:hypothetical protein EDC01DRAFT_787598 [Geopyxis carbonaria]|nr:hypothetical protein EDC01DRAFT_787598 [Geopyxis carbonaria]